MLILKYLVPRASLSPSPSPQRNRHHVLHRFPYFVLVNLTIRHKYWIYKTVCQAKPLKFLIKLYTDHKTLWVKHATHRKSDSYKRRFSFKCRQNGKQQLNL